MQIGKELGMIGYQHKAQIPALHRGSHKKIWREPQEEGDKPYRCAVHTQLARCHKMATNKTKKKANNS